MTRCYDYSDRQSKVKLLIRLREAYINLKELNIGSIKIVQMARKIGIVKLLM